MGVPTIRGVRKAAGFWQESQCRMRVRVPPALNTRNSWLAMKEPCVKHSKHIYTHHGSLMTSRNGLRPRDQLCACVMMYRDVNFHDAHTCVCVCLRASRALDTLFLNNAYRKAWRVPCSTGPSRSSAPNNTHAPAYATTPPSHTRIHPRAQPSGD